MSDFTAQEIATLQSRLDKQLGPEYISTRPGAGGGKVHYLAAEKVINLANEVFGFNGWSSGIQNVQIDFVDENPQNGKITLGLSTIVRVSLKDGTYHEDIGYGHIENCKGKAAAFEKAKKEAATDALKRALRTFGNVLGNCLYDKDYLQKITKVKSGPSRWDPENLHRHADFGPIRKQSIADAEAQHDTTMIQRRQQSVQTNGSFGSAEFEDDFGGNVFDDVDFNHPDEVQMDDSNATTPAHKAMNAPQPQPGMQRGVQRMHSMPQLQQIRPGSPLAVPNQQQPQKPPVMPRQTNNSAQAPQNRMPPPQPSVLQQKQQQPSGVPTHPLPEGQPSRSNTSSGSTIPDVSGNTNQQSHARTFQADPHEERDVPVPGPPPPGIPEGFVTGRSADMLNKPPEHRLSAATVAPFNPHAESPSIRRTSGVNPGKSAAITREALQKATTSNQAVPALGSGSNGQNAPIRTNFVNPAADANRRIGMPPAAMQNRNAYRPPTAVKRPALTDVSNLQQTDGVSEPKKPKVDLSPQKQSAVQDIGGQD